MPFRERTERLDRSFKRTIAAITALALAAAVAASPTGRYTVASLAEQAREAAKRQIGLEPTRGEIDALWRLKRARGIEQTTKVLTNFYNETTPEMRRLFDVAGMDPEHGLVRYGRADQAFLLSSEVFERLDNGRSYRMRPNFRSVWLRQITLHNGPFGLFQVQDTPEARAAAVAAGGIVDDTSITTTNSWGCRGPEPDPGAPIRGIVLGDSFMQGMFVGDDDIPPLMLQRHLQAEWKQPVSILDTGHIGYSPEQYYYSLKEYGERFRPHFVVISVCPNDFGDEYDVIAGRGDWWDEATYWLDETLLWCRGRGVTCLLVTVPCDKQVNGLRKDAYYPARISNIFHAGSTQYLDPMDLFLDEHLRLLREARATGRPTTNNPLFNAQINDNHFSVRGSQLWGEVVGRRLTLLMDRPGPDRSSPGHVPDPGATGD